MAEGEKLPSNVLWALGVLEMDANDCGIVFGVPQGL